ncbi:MAG: hypothetical protein J7L69_05245 [Desulfobulbaceae bacterium]|nr:hypothetical protein [Desulfobulbaceae bacterium]
MKRIKGINEHAVLRVIIATGISSVVTQLLTIREFLSRFQGNEIVIALALFNWLLLGGIGTLFSRSLSRFFQPTANRLAWLSLILAAFANLQILLVRTLRDFVFIPGSSVGFYPTFIYTFFTILPYCLLLGFVLPYSLYLIRTRITDYPGAKVYIVDNIGDVSGGILFSFCLVFWATPMQAICLANLPLLLASWFLFPRPYRLRPLALAGSTLTLLILVSGILTELQTLAPAQGRLVHYRESRYGRIEMQQDREQFTLFQDGVPVFSNQNLSMAEETVHYPLSQLREKPKNILLISAEGGMMAEIAKYEPERVDYVELDPQVTSVLFDFGLLQKIDGLSIIHRDGRAWLSETEQIYDAIIVNLPEPDTFQINRFFTDRFYELARSHLAPHGILSFSVTGFDNFLAEPQRLKLSSLRNTAAAHFNHVLLLPGQTVFFLCSSHPIDVDIPALLEKKGIETCSIEGFYHGNISPERISSLNSRMDREVAINLDEKPHLMAIMFDQWFAKYDSSPIIFIVVLAGSVLFYLFRLSREEFVLFSTGAMTMGSEMLVIFAFQIYYGYIYFQIGLIVTVFLAGLLPGAWYGERLRSRGRQVLLLSDSMLIGLLILLIVALKIGGDLLPVPFYLVFGFMVSLICGFQFPVALYLRGGDNPAVARVFSADLIGAGFGTLFTSLVLIPYCGLIWAAAGLIGMKCISLLVVGSRKES